MFGKNELTRNIFIIIFHVRVDGYHNSFSIIQLLNEKNKNYYNNLSKMGYKGTLKKLMSVAYKQYNKKRLIANYMLGSTIFVSQYPKFWNEYDQTYSMLPRPYKNCQTNGKAQKMLNEQWLKNLIFDITIYCRLHLQQMLFKSKKENDKEKTMEILYIIKLINFAENRIPQSLRLGQTFFTQLVIVGDMIQNENQILSHFDEEDIISCIVTLGDLRTGGETIYYNGIKQNVSSDIEMKIPFQHCRLQIGSFDKILHGVSPWVGPRITLNFNLKKKIVNHFQLFGNKYYGQYENDGYPKYSLY